MIRAEAVLRFVRFLGVGAVGFVVDSGVFTALVASGLASAYGARPIAFALAATTTWLLNRSLVFADRAGGPAPAEAARYFGATLLSGAVNLGVYFAVIRLFGAETPFLQLAFVAGVGAGLVTNYTLYSLVVFRRRK